MKKLWVIPLVVLGILIVVTPAAGQDPTGACWRLEDDDAACFNGLTAQECAETFSWTDPVWGGGLDCAGLDVPFQWDGSCQLNIAPIGDQCVLMWTLPGGPTTSPYHCEELDEGTWFDNLTCEGVPVPAMPKPGLAVMAFVLLAVTLAGLAARVS